MWLQRSSSYKFTENHSKQNQELNVSWIIDIYIYIILLIFLHGTQRLLYYYSTYIYMIIYVYQHLFWSSIFSSYIINYPKKPGFWMCLFPERAPSSLNWGLQSQHVGTPGSRSSQGTLRMPRRRAPRKDQAEALEVEVAIIIYIYIYIIIHDRLESYIVIYNHI